MIDTPRKLLILLRKASFICSHPVYGLLIRLDSGLGILVEANLREENHRIHNPGESNEKPLLSLGPDVTIIQRL